MLTVGERNVLDDLWRVMRDLEALIGDEPADNPDERMRQDWLLRVRASVRQAIHA